MWLSERTALVTGGGRGIGAAVTRRLAAAGARLLIWGRTAIEVEGLAGGDRRDARMHRRGGRGHRRQALVIDGGQVLK